MDHLRRLLRPAAHVVIAAGMMTISTVAARADADPTGVWINDTGRGAIEIKPCGKTLCGHVVWVKDSNDAKGCGKQIIGDAVPVGGGTWDNGWIYSPERKQTYDVELKPLSNGTLRVTGYAGVKFLSKTMIWTKAPADLKRCGAETIEATAKPSAPSGSAGATPSETAAAAASAKTAQPSTEVTKSATAPPGTTEGNSTPTSGAGQNVATASDPASTDAKSEKSATGTGSGADNGSKNSDTEADKTAGDAAPPHKKSHLKLGDLGLDRVFTRTPSGSCKLDLPFVKVRFNCDRD